MNININNLEELICIIPVGQKNAKSQKKIAEELHIKPEQLKGIIQKYRRISTDRNKYICSCGRGYFIAENEHELLQFRRMMHAQAKARFVTVQQINRITNDIDGQQSIDQGDGDESNKE